MSLLRPTPPEKLVDPQGRPYFLWDVDMTLDAFRDRLAHGEVQERAVLLGKLMRQARPIQTASTFHRMRVRDGAEDVLVDLFADPVTTIEAPVIATIGSVRFQVDTAHEILVNKLCALVSRSEVRDLVDLRGLLGAGGDLDRALADAPRKDGGFSALILIWALKQLQLVAPGLEEQLLVGLEDFRRDLLERLTRASAPDGSP